MGRKYAIRDQQGIYFVTFTVVQWIDVFIRDEYRQVIVEGICYCQKNKGLRIHAYCLMTSHVHLILSVENSLRLSDVIRDLKRFTSSQLKKVITNNVGESRRNWLLRILRNAGKRNPRNSEFQLWQQHNHPIELDRNKMMDQRLDYIHNNPVVAGFVDDPGAWLWSSCASYERGVTEKIPLLYIE